MQNEEFGGFDDNVFTTTEVILQTVISINFFICLYA